MIKNSSLSPANRKYLGSGVGGLKFWAPWLVFPCFVALGLTLLLFSILPSVKWAKSIYLTKVVWRWNRNATKLGKAFCIMQNSCWHYSQILICFRSGLMCLIFFLFHLTFFQINEQVGENFSFCSMFSLCFPFQNIRSECHSCTFLCPCPCYSPGSKRPRKEGRDLRPWQEVCRGRQIQFSFLSLHWGSALPSSALGIGDPGWGG